MTIFGNTTSSSSSLVDTTVTYTYSSLLILSSLLALLLNPLVLIYNTLQRSTLVTRLFQLLSIVDIIFLIRPVNALYNLLKPELDPMFIPDPSLGRKVVCLVTYVTGFSSMFLTLTLCVVRYVKIRFPFWSMSHDTYITGGVVVGVTVDFIWNLSASIYTNFYPSKHFWASATQSVLYEPAHDDSIVYIRIILFIGPFFFKIGLSVVFSILTLVYLRTDNGMQVSEIKKRSIMMILILNLGNVGWCVVSIIVQTITRFQNAPVPPEENTEWRYWYFYLQFIESVLMQSLLVAYNPLVICCRNSGMRRMLRDLVRYGQVVAPDTVESSTDPAARRGEGIIGNLGRSISNVSGWSRARLLGR